MRKDQERFCTQTRQPSHDNACLQRAPPLAAIFFVALCTIVLLAPSTASAVLIEGEFVNDGDWGIGPYDPLTIGPAGWLRNNGTIVQYGCSIGPGWYPDCGGVLNNDGIIDNAGTLTNVQHSTLVNEAGDTASNDNVLNNSDTMRTRTSCSPRFLRRRCSRVTSGS